VRFSASHLSVKEAPQYRELVLNLLRVMHYVTSMKKIFHRRMSFALSFFVHSANVALDQHILYISISILRNFYSDVIIIIIIIIIYDLFV